MPLLSATGATIEHICLGCEGERRVPPAELRREEDEPTFSVNCPTCGATESFSWHDWVYITYRVMQDGPRRTPTTIEEPDPDHPGAQQMVLIERVARQLGFTAPRGVGRPPDRAYPRPPRAPSPDEVRRMTRDVRAQRGFS